MQKIKLLNETIEYMEETHKPKNILFLHGFNSSLLSFQSLKNLKRNYNIIAFNFPGNGNSTFNETINLERYIKIAHKFIIQKKLCNLIIVGHSLGGAVANALSTMKEVKQVILLAPFNPFIKEFHNWQILKQLSPTNFQEAKKSWKSMVQNKNKKKYFENIDSSARTFLKKINKTKQRFSYMLLHEINSNEFHKNILQKIYEKSTKNKIIIFSGNRDFFVSKESSLKTASIFGYKFILIPNVGHSIIYEHTKDMNKYFNDLS